MREAPALELVEAADGVGRAAQRDRPVLALLHLHVDAERGVDAADLRGAGAARPKVVAADDEVVGRDDVDVELERREDAGLRRGRVRRGRVLLRRLLGARSRGPWPARRASPRPPPSRWSSSPAPRRRRAAPPPRTDWRTAAGSGRPRGARRRSAPRPTSRGCRTSPVSFRCDSRCTLPSSLSMSLKSSESIDDVDRAGLPLVDRQVPLDGQRRCRADRGSGTSGRGCAPAAARCGVVMPRERDVGLRHREARRSAAST